MTKHCFYCSSYSIVCLGYDKLLIKKQKYIKLYKYYYNPLQARTNQSLIEIIALYYTPNKIRIILYLQM